MTDLWGRSNCRTSNKLWGFLPHDKMVANVVGLPTSQEQTESPYSVGQLREALQMIRAIRNRLYDLRQKWPV
jgi:hypothetical protein